MTSFARSSSTVASSYRDLFCSSSAWLARLSRKSSSNRSKSAR